MTYMSDLTGKLVVDVNGERIGRLEDLVASIRGEMPHPEIVALVVKRRRGRIIIPFGAVAVLTAPVIALSHRLGDVVPYEPHPHDLYLARDVVDKQIIDINGFRVVRVNDLDLARVNGHVYVANVDIGGLGLLRRLGLGKVAQEISAHSPKEASLGIISWDSVDLLPGDQLVRLKVPGERMKDLHPADLAEIISDLNRAESSKLLEALDVKTVADTLEEVEPDLQASLVESMPNDKVADVLGEMAPDEAADLLAELPQDRSQELLSLMEHEDAEDVRKLLAYPENSAGGIMNTEYITVRPDLTAEQAVAVLRKEAHEAETVLYIYVTDSEGHLVGVFSVLDLVLARPEARVREFMHHSVTSVNLLDSQELVAQAVAKYNLLAVPVVDDQGCLHGLVTADDALDKIIPTAWKRRLPRLYR